MPHYYLIVCDATYRCGCRGDSRRKCAVATMSFVNRFTQTRQDGVHCNHSRSAFILHSVPSSSYSTQPTQYTTRATVPPSTRTRHFFFSVISNLTTTQNLRARARLPTSLRLPRGLFLGARFHKALRRGLHLQPVYSKGRALQPLESPGQTKPYVRRPSPGGSFRTKMLRL